MFCPLENGVPAVNGETAAAAPGTVSPLFGPAAPATSTRPKVAAEATRSTIPASCSRTQLEREIEPERDLNRSVTFIFTY
jgi:hypothetical protein